MKNSKGNQKANWQINTVIIFKQSRDAMPYLSQAHTTKLS